MLAEELRAHGVINRDPFALEAALFALFDKFGETLPGMLLTRQGVRFSNGWDLRPCGPPVRPRPSDWSSTCSPTPGA